MNRNSPEVSIVIINYNTFDLTKRCIQSIIEMSQPIRYEIIVVDNASTENPDKLTALFPDILMIKSEQNLGFAKGNNLGITKASGDHILLLNSDAFFLNDVLSPLLNFLKENSSTAVVTGRLEFPNGAVQHNCQRFPSMRYKLFELLRLQKIVSRNRAGKILFGFFFSHDQVAFPDWVWGTCFMFRRKLLNELPLRRLRDDFFMYGEDMQWCKEVKGLGYKIAFLPQPRVLHLLGASGAKKDDMMAINLNKFMTEYYSPVHRFGIRFLNLLLVGKYGY
jgi:GT2 family glycosyltransferase